MATTPEAPPAIIANAPVTWLTSSRIASSRPASRLIATVPRVTATIGSRAGPMSARADRLTSDPIVTPISAWPMRKDQPGRASGVGDVRACAIPPIRDANSTADGTCSTERTTLRTRVTPPTIAAACHGVRARLLIADQPTTHDPEAPT